MPNSCPTPDQVVAAFNCLGYPASFAAVGARLRPKVDAAVLYRQYPSREVLGEVWLCRTIPELPESGGLADAFAACVFTLLETLQSKRDFSLAWLSALKVTGPLHLPEMHDLHASLHKAFFDWLDANHRNLSFPDHVQPRDVLSEVADALCALTVWLVTIWAADRSADYHHTRKLVEASAYLIDGLLWQREEFGQAGLLRHLHAMFEQPHEQVLKPLLDMLLKPDRVRRLASPVNLVEALRAFGLPSDPLP